MESSWWPQVHGGTVGNLSNKLNNSGVGAKKASGMTDPKFEASKENVLAGWEVRKLRKHKTGYSGVRAGKTNKYGPQFLNF